MNNIERFVVIMAGGVGSRFWPSSTEAKPKQFLDITGSGQSLLRTTFERCLPFIPKENIIVITNISYKPLVIHELTELPENNILCEPSRNNTAPSIAYAALHIKARNAHSSFAVLSSDHIIAAEDVFRKSIETSFDFAENNNALMTLSIEASRPDTGYGYLEFGEAYGNVYKVISFKEKPDLETAKKYLSQDNYVWNSGMFVWKTSVILEALQKYAPSIVEKLSEEVHHFNTNAEQDYINEVYPYTENISIDFAVMEKADNVFTLPASMGWSDLGTWNSLYDFSIQDENKNVIIGNNNHLIKDSEGCLIKMNDKKKVLIRGLENFIIVDEEDALLIYPRNLEQEIKGDQAKLNK